MKEAEIDLLVNERILCRKNKDYEGADRIKIKLTSLGIKIIDIIGCQSSWKKVIDKRFIPENQFPQIQQSSLMDFAKSSYDLKLNKDLNNEKIAKIAKSFLYYSLEEDLATENISDNSDKSSNFITLLSSEREMQGRKFADAAFEFSMAGVTDCELFDLLVKGSTSELKRTGFRQSCRAVDICRIVEKLAVAGVRDNEFYYFSADLLSTKSSETVELLGTLRSGNFSLFSDRPLLWLWRFASKQHKEGNQNDQNKDKKRKIDEETLNETDHPCAVAGSEAGPGADGPDLCWASLFADPTLPLVIDLGCGFGVFLLQLAFQQHDQINKAEQQCNFLGCDMSGRAVAYANGIAARWDLKGHFAAVQCDVVVLLNAVLADYAGPVQWVIINFPTPYRSDLLSVSAPALERGGNAQLPSDLSTFMVTAQVLELSRRLLLLPSAGHRHCPHQLYVQSNVEDVAVTIADMVKQSAGYGTSSGFVPVEAEVVEPLESTAVPCRRLQRYLSSGGRRAVGPGFVRNSPLPSRTETEAACGQQGTPVHRLLFCVLPADANGNTARQLT